MNHEELTETRNLVAVLTARREALQNQAHTLEYQADDLVYESPLEERDAMECSPDVLAIRREVAFLNARVRACDCAIIALSQDVADRYTVTEVPGTFQDLIAMGMQPVELLRDE